MNKILEVKNVEKIYGKKAVITKALNDVSFTVYEKEFVAIMGASGSGKTTLLNTVASIDFPTSGKIIIDGKCTTDLNSNELANFRKEKLGFVFQDFNLLNSLNAYENIALPLSLLNVKKLEIVARVNEIANMLGIAHCLEKYPYQMSGGEKQRCAAARAIVTNPKLILADEPTGALDSKSSRTLLESFTSLNVKCSATILMVTHDAYAASYANRVLFIKDGSIFNEIYCGDLSQKDFFNKIMDVVSLLGGDLNA